MGILELVRVSNRFSNGNGAKLTEFVKQVVDIELAGRRLGDLGKGDQAMSKGQPEILRSRMKGRGIFIRRKNHGAK